MALTVACWNMAHWSHQQHTERAWDYLDSAVCADISLVQEAVPPTARQGDECVWQEIRGTRRWGSGVLTRGFPVSAVTLQRHDYPGALTVAEVTLPDRSTLIAISLYGQMDEHGYAITTLHRMLSDLTHLLEGKLLPGRRPRVVLGGDFNASPQCDDRYHTKTHRVFFDRLHAFGMRDCQGVFTDHRRRTLRHAKSPVPWVNDYIYASESLTRSVIAHRVLEDPEVLALSDHNPVVVTFDL